MHIPPYHKKRSWQIFILGLFIGSMIAYLVLTMMYGRMYEDILSEKFQLQTKVSELTKQNEALLQDKEQLKEKNLIIHTVDIHFLNSKELRLDQLIIHQLKELLTREIDYVIGKEVESIAESDGLLIRFIENKTITIDELSYDFEVRRLTIAEQITLSLQVNVTN